MGRLEGRQAAAVFLCFASGYLLSYAFRSVNAVIAPSLVTDAGLSNADLGLLSSAYFLSFASLQLPLGILLDRYGPRRVETTLLLFAALGAAVFASSSSLAGLWTGRALIGVGVSACLMAPYTAYRQWFPAERQSQLASWMLVAGTLGALASTVPVNAALPLVGWRGVFWIMSGLILASAAAIFVVLKRVEAVHPLQTRVPSPAGQGGYRQIFRSPVFRRMALLGMVNQGSFVALQTLWAGPWMMTVLGMDKQETAGVLFAINLGLMSAYLMMSWLAPRYIAQGERRGLPVTRVIAAGIAGAVLVQALILWSSAPSAWLLWLLLVLCVPVGTLVQTSVSLSFPSALAGRANSGYNFLIFIGAFVAQWGIGLLIDIAEGRGMAPADAMRFAFGICLALQAVSWVAFVAQRAEPVNA
ncbi:MAG TPA: MFS transporter [Noviherbaspirillum sp.]|jgi:MFS family permease|uniref:MFS transporter n=1 Tax=Noviherbaspirillum sp. TaxID=1926288 RepID=UPI002F930757